MALLQDVLPWTPEVLLRGVVALVFGAGLVAAVTTDPPPEPLDRDAVATCALEAGQALLGVQPALIELTAPTTATSGPDGPAIWEAVVAGGGAVLRISYRDGDGGVADARLGTGGGTGELDAERRSLVFGLPCR